MKNHKTNTPSHSVKSYVSLFSGAGIGCYGFTDAKFKCVATVELLEKRIKYQKFNNVCEFESGYICGDVSDNGVLENAKNTIKLNLAKLNSRQLDVMLATPPCQGMSVANHKKNDELPRNSLVIESIKLVEEFQPKFFIFENVPSFLKTICEDSDLKHKTIEEAIYRTLGSSYKIASKKMNFAEYGSQSSRTRCLVIGVHNSVKDVSPESIFPCREASKSLKELISNLPSLTWGEINKDDIYHSFRTYQPEMRAWISELTEGESAFDNKDAFKRPHRVVDGVFIENKNGNGDKYKRQIWSKIAPCVHTRNDILASQNTVHPEQDRVFSIRELMKMMTIPDAFKFSDKDISNLTEDEKRAFLKKEELNIRHSIGEAVPTNIFRKIASNILNTEQSQNNIKNKFEIFILATNVIDQKGLAAYIKENGLSGYRASELQAFSELLNTSKNEDAAYYTNVDLVAKLVKSLPEFKNKKSLKIIEPSVGSGCFILPLLEKYSHVKNISLDLFDVNNDALKVLESILNASGIPKNIKINYLHGDFLLANHKDQYDIAIGNPPFMKIPSSHRSYGAYKSRSRNRKTNNIFNFFLERVVDIADYVSFIVPKSILGAPEFNETRCELSKFEFDSIYDFGEKGFKGVLIETIGLNFYTRTFNLKNKIQITSLLTGKSVIQDQDKVMPENYPTWLLYRDESFEVVASKLKFDCFNVFRDRQISTKNLEQRGQWRVLKSANIGNGEVVDLPEKDKFISSIEKLSVKKYLNIENAILIPNLTYLPRACFKPANTLVDGSAAVLTEKSGKRINEKQLGYFASKEFRDFYKICRNYSTRSMNIDANYVFYFGLINE